MIDAATMEIIDATVARTIAQMQAQQAPKTDEVLTRAEAKLYVKRNSDRAFGRWCKEWSVRSSQHGRYSRTQLDVALNREARKRR